jgi:hypothetical protein
MNKKTAFLLAGIIILAIFFRFYQIAVLPGGLFPDEAANGLDINSMQQGDLQPFYERGNGREALFFYMLWGSVESFGKGPWQHHVVSSFVGLLSVILCFFVTRKLLGLATGFSEKQATTTALLASFFMATSTWHTTLSRTAFRANLIPLFTSATIYLLLLAYKSSTKVKQYIFSILAGACFALGFYSYIAYRIMAPLLILIILWPLLAEIFKTKSFFVIKKWFLAFVLFCIAFAIAIAPLANYFYTHPGSFVGRSGQVSVFNPELNNGNLLGTIGEVTKQSLLGFVTIGDLNWRHNISGMPFLSPLYSIFFILGLISMTLLAARYTFSPRKRSGDWPYFVLAGWFWSMLIPVITTAEGIPHGLRSIGTIPVIFIMSAWGLVQIYKFAARLIEFRHTMQKDWQLNLVKNATKVMVVVFIIAVTLHGYTSYFVYAANSPENYYAFRSDLTVVSNYINNKFDNSNANGKEDNTFLVLDKFSVQTVDYLTSLDGKHPQNPINQPYTQVDPEDSWKLSGLKGGDQIIFCQSSIFDIPKFKNSHPNAKLEREARNKFGQTVMAIYRIY